MKSSDIDVVRLPLKATWARQVLIGRGILRLDMADLMYYAFKVPDNAKALTVSITEMDEGATAVYAYDGNDWEESVEVPAGSWNETFGQICMAIDSLLAVYAALDTEAEKP